MNLDDSDRLGDHQLDPIRIRSSDITRFGVERLAVSHPSGSLSVGDERFTGPGVKRRFLQIFERADGRVSAATLALPGSEQKSQSGQIRMGWGHLAAGTWHDTPVPFNPQ